MNTTPHDYRASTGGRIIRQTINLAAALLLAGATAVAIGLWAGAGLTPPADPVLGVSTRWMLVLGAAVAAGVAIHALRGRLSPTKAALLLWLGVNGVVYAAALGWNGSRGCASAVLGGVASAFGLSPGTAAWLATSLLAVTSLAGGAALGWLWLGGHLAQAGRMTCPACGGHVEFALKNRGEEIPCPHCQARITLRTDEALKMACYFCKGHLEFPSHALGTLMPCPHCRKDITLMVARAT